MTIGVDYSKNAYFCHNTCFFIPSTFSTMRKKLLFLFLALCLGAVGFAAGQFPKISSGSNITWYFIKFANSNLVIETRHNGKEVVLAGMTGRSTQLWKVEGTAAAGYTFTNQAGQQLYLKQVAKNELVMAGNSSTHHKFAITASGNSKFASAFEIHPQENKQLSFNQWRGPSSGNNIGLWTSGNDDNNPLVFETAEAIEVYKKMPALIPYPRQITVSEGARLQLSTLQSITFPTDSLKEIAADFAAQLDKAAGIALSVRPTAATPATHTINLIADAALNGEAYRLDITADGVNIRAGHRAGFFYALQTLRQLLPPALLAGTHNAYANWSLPQLAIQDQPLLTHRGYMLDIARHFFDKNEVKRILDIMALYKMNRLHWHLTDDQGWRIEIPEYPKLTSVGSRRAGSFVNEGSSPWFFDDTEYGRGMFYTLDDLREIVAYAAARNIEILPEIDMPGHMVAALAAYPELSCLPSRQYRVRINAGISKDVLNVGDDNVIKFLKTVLGHVAEVFPGKYIHLGGDECPTDRWRENKLCQQRIKDQHLSSVDELQPWLVEELAEFLKTKYNKDIVVWDELIAKDKTAFWKKPTTRVKPLIMAWNLPDGRRWDKATELVAADYGFQSVIVPYNVLYLDWMQVSNADADINEGYRGGWGDNAVNSLDKIYNFNPLAHLGESKSKFALGVQGNMWTETCNRNSELEYQLLPRLLALSEIAWLPNDKKNWTSFLLRLQQHTPIFDALHFTYAKHFIFSKDDTPFRAAFVEADTLLKATRPGQPGYVDQAAYDALKTVVEANQTAYTTGTDAPEAPITDAIKAYKAAPITQPTEGTVYRLISASTYYKKQYAGSILYNAGNDYRVHYGQQDEPEELFTCVREGDGWLLKSFVDGSLLSMPTYGLPAKPAKTGGTPLRFDAATVPAGNYDYIPGAMTISSVTGYNAAATGKVKRLFIKTFGSNNKNDDVPNENKVVANDDPTVCNPGTWRIVPADFRVMLQGLATRCNNILEDAVPDKVGQPSQEAIAFLKDLSARVKNALATASEISQSQYETFVADYNAFLKMPRLTPVQSLEEGFYYVIRNAHFQNYLARVNAQNKVYPSQEKTGTFADTFLWRIVKKADGSILLVNKSTTQAATVASTADGTTVNTGSDYAWTLQLQKTDTGTEGINILAAGGKNGWYTNPASFATIVLKPGSWGGSVWIFEKTATPVGIVTPSHRKATDEKIYDLTGRTPQRSSHGVRISSEGEKTIR